MMTLYQSEGRVSGNWVKFETDSGWHMGHITARVTGKALKGEWISTRPGPSEGGRFFCVMGGRGSMTVSNGSGPPCTGIRQ